MAELLYKAAATASRGEPAAAGERRARRSARTEDVIDAEFKESK